MSPESPYSPNSWLTSYPISYTYEVCLFGEAKQKPNNGGSSFSLGYVLFTMHRNLILIRGHAAISPHGMTQRALRSARPNTTANSTTPRARSAGTVPSAAYRYALPLPPRLRVPDTSARSSSGHVAQTTRSCPCRSLRNVSTSSQGRHRPCVCHPTHLRRSGKSCNVTPSIYPPSHSNEISSLCKYLAQTNPLSLTAA
jgi:hypothetical protein